MFTKKIPHILGLALFSLFILGLSPYNFAGQETNTDASHAYASERLIKVMRQLFSVVHGEDMATETEVTQEQLTDMVEAVEELLFYAEVMSNKIPATEMEETQAVIFSALADRLYDEALNVQQLATNYDTRVIDTAQNRLLNEAYHRLNRTCNACHQTFRN